MYDNVIESLETFNSSPGLGCILAHSMGLGKTIQVSIICESFVRYFTVFLFPIQLVIKHSNWNCLFQAAAFCDIFLNYTSGNTVLVIVPINTIQNWLNEFNQWLPSANISEASSAPSTPKKRGRRKVKVESETECSLPKESESNEPSASASPEISDPDETLDGVKSDASSTSRAYNVFLLNETVKNLAGREKIISEWSAKRGVLLIGYEMYRMLALKKLKRPGKKISSMIENGKIKRDEDDSILDRIHSCLVNPGPDLVICDEGHRIKNSGASISQALKAIKTKRRIVLTGKSFLMFTYVKFNMNCKWTCIQTFSYLHFRLSTSKQLDGILVHGRLH